MTRTKFGGRSPRPPSGPWTEKRRAFQIREMRDEAVEAQASHALTSHQAALAVVKLYDQTGSGRFSLEEIDATELDALGSLIEAELEDRRRREAAEFNHSLNLTEQAGA